MQTQIYIMLGGIFDRFFYSFGLFGNFSLPSAIQKFTETSLVLSGIRYFCWRLKRLFRPSFDRLGGLEGHSCLWCRFILFAHKFVWF